MEHLIELRQPQFIHFGNDIFVPLSLKTEFMKQQFYLFASQISNIISMLYSYIYPKMSLFSQMVKRDIHSIAKIYKLVLFDSLEWWQIIAIVCAVFVGLCLSESIEKWRRHFHDLQEMKSNIKDNKLTIDLLQIQLADYKSKFDIVIYEVDAIHQEMNTYLKKLKKVERDIKKMDYC